MDPSLAPYSPSTPLTLNRRRVALLVSFAASIILCIAVQNYLWGGLALLATGGLLLSDEEPSLRRRMGVLLGCILVLTFCDINTGLDNRNFLQVGLPFAAVVVVPALLLRRTDPGVIRFALWPRRFRWIDILYVVLSVPLAYFLLKFYWSIDPFMPSHWPLPQVKDPEQTLRLIVGVNAVGIWDELFFVNTSYAILRSLFGFKTANAAQAVLYTCVLYDMAFTGNGLWIVYFFAWTQGMMFEESENLLYVLLVHLIVDALLVAAILAGSYSGPG